MGYALWLVPAKHDKRALERLMAFRPRSYRRKTGSRSYPKFPPHVTLVTFSASSPPAIDSVVPPDIPQKLTFEDLLAGSTYLGASFMTISEKDKLIALYEYIVCRLMAVHKVEAKSRGRHFPHMSLFYVDEADERRRLKKELEETGRVQKRADKKSSLLNYDPGNKNLKPMAGFTADEIWLMDCTSQVVGEWVMKERWPIPSGGRQTVNRTGAAKSKQVPHPPETSTPLHTVVEREHIAPATKDIEMPMVLSSVGTGGAAPSGIHVRYQQISESPSKLVNPVIVLQDSEAQTASAQTLTSVPTRSAVEPSSLGSISADRNFQRSAEVKNRSSTSKVAETLNTCHETSRRDRREDHALLAASVNTWQTTADSVPKCKDETRSHLTSLGQSSYRRPSPVPLTGVPGNITPPPQLREPAGTGKEIKSLGQGSNRASPASSTGVPGNIAPPPQVRKPARTGKPGPTGLEQSGHHSSPIPQIGVSRNIAPPQVGVPAGTGKETKNLGQGSTRASPVSSTRVPRNIAPPPQVGVPARTGEERKSLGQGSTRASPVSSTRVPGNIAPPPQVGVPAGTGKGIRSLGQGSNRASPVSSIGIPGNIAPPSQVGVPAGTGKLENLSVTATATAHTKPKKRR